MESSTHKKKKKVFDAKKKMQNMSKEQIRAAIEKKKECNARALGIVERLIEPEVDRQWLIENLIHINQCHFQDAVEERAISKCCGYPLCDGQLKNIPNKQYHISTKQNKVFDITERKNYCSNNCYQAGVFLKDQLFTSPLWLRDCEDVVTYVLYSSAPSSGITGLEIDLGNTNPAKPDDDAESQKSNTQNDQKHESEDQSSTTREKEDCDNDSDQFEDAEEEMEDISEKMKSTQIHSAEEEKHELFFMSRTEIGNEHEECKNENGTNHGGHHDHELATGKFCFNEDVKRQDKRKSGNKYEQRNANKKIKPNVPVDLKIESIIMEWFTVESLTYIYGEEAVKGKFEQFGSPLNEVNFNKMKDAYMYERYEEICRRLNILEIRDREDKIPLPLKPLPDYDELKREAKQLELKVRSFYRGDAKVTFQDENEENETQKSNENDGDDFEPILPLIDKHAIKATRRRIVLDKLNRTFPDIMSALNLGQFNIRKELQELVHTLSLSASNIVMKPPEWNLVALVLIRILTIRNEFLKPAYYSDLTQRRLVNLLMTYNLDLNFLEKQVLNINDIELIIRNSQ